MDFYKRTGIRPFGNYMPMLGQAAVFCSMFFALRGMAECPVESLKTGGTLWFLDLTQSDPMFLIPIVTSTSLFIHIKTGADGANIDTLPSFYRKFILVMPFISLPFMCYFPTVSSV